MNDFRVIANFRNWVYQSNLAATNFIQGSVDENDVVITHHLPLNESISPRFMNSDLNNFYVCDMSSLIKSRGPKLWIHGHTHDSKDYEVEHTLTTHKTRIVCNPRGYTPNDINPDFRKDWIIEL
jgi:Icc-related predicted phosphoesterase